MRRLILGVLFVTASAMALPAGPPEIEPLEEYRSRRARLASSVDGAIVLVAAPPTDLVEFQQEDNFYYLTGFSAPQAALILDRRNGQTSESLFIPRRDPAQERWTGVQLGPGSEAEATTGVASVQPRDDFDDAVRQLADDGQTIYTLTADRSTMAELNSIAPSADFANVAPEIANLRLVKADTEIALLERAIAITMEAHDAAAGVIAPNVMEYEVEGIIEYTFRRNGAERPAFPSIVGSGPFTTILHYDRNDRRMQSGDLVVVDIGAEYSGYAADITRTYPVNGRFSDRQREIYQIVLDAQKAALQRVRPGVSVNGPGGVHEAAREYIDGQGYGEYFIHGTSHYLGLYVHDVGGYSRPLEPGMILTVEPGIYLPEEGLGVRIEDDVLVTADGYELLSTFPREVAEIEALMAERRGQ